MSTTIDAINHIQLTQFWGGDERNICIQLTELKPKEESNGYIQMNVIETYEMIIKLTKWLKVVNRTKKEKLDREIAKNKELSKTIFQEISDCEKFISDLKITAANAQLIFRNANYSIK